MSTPPDQLDEASVSDAELIAAARTGDAGALGALYGRHVEAARAVASRYTNSAADADDVVSDSFAAVMGALQRGNGPTEAFRAYLFTVVRRVAGTRRDAARREQPTDDLAALETGTAWAGSAEDPALAGFERGVVARAFHSLPERWQAVLWHTEVDGLNPAQIAPILGISANSVAALAYRAREGLRQAYLQQHLGDPLEPGCRAFAGKLGSYVRGGLGTRETAAVERHLDECGECRGLVLELGDVNHGMRAVIAPLVLGVVGLGAIAGLAPVAAGLGAGAAAATGAGHGGGGAAGGGAAGGAAAGAGVTTGAVSTVGAGAGATAGASGLAAFVASIPPTVAALVAGGVVVAGIATAAIIANRDGEPAVVAPSVTSSATATPAPTATDGTPAPSTTVPPTTAPTTDPGTVPTLPPPPAGPGDQPTEAPTVPPTSPPTTPPPTTPPTDPPTTPPPAPPSVAVVLPDGGLSLDAGVAGQELRFGVQNSGGSPAAGLEASVTLPEGVELDAISVPDLLGGPGFSVAAAAALWSCDRFEGSATAARCTLDELPAGASAELLLRVSVPESYDRTDGAVQVSVSGGGLDFRSDPIPVRVQPAPARLAVASAPGSVSLVAGRTRPFSVELVNAGGRSSAVTATVTLPDGVTGSAAAGSPWACEPADGALTCTLDGLGPRRTSTLALDLRAAGTDVEGVVRLTLSPSGHGAPGTATVPVEVVAPATLTLSGSPSSVPVAGGQPTSVSLRVGNAGGVASGPVVLRVERTGAVRWADDPVPGWSCDDAETALTCTGPSLDPGDDVAATLRLVGVPGEFGTQALRLAATASDADPSERVETALDVEHPRLSVTTDLQLMPDGTGTLSGTASTEGADAARARVVVDVPPNLVLDPGVVEEACDVLERGTRRVICDLGTVRVGEERAVLVGIRSASAGLRSASVTVTAAGADAAVDRPTARTSSAGLSPRASVAGAAVAQAGAPLLTCKASKTCTSALGGAGVDNNSLTMTTLDEHPYPPSDRAHTTAPVSSSARLSVPAGRSVQWAGLYWSANRAPGAGGWSADLRTATLRGPGVPWTRLSAQVGDVTTVTDNAHREYYQSFVDVTDLVRGSSNPSGTWSVADVAVGGTLSGPDPTFYAGWALVVVYADGSDRTATVYDGGAWVGAGADAPVFRFAADRGTDVRVGVVAWEGDRGGSGDRLTLGSECSPATRDLTPLRGDGSLGTASNAFDSTATGWRWANSLGVDVKAFDLADLDCEVGSLTPTTTGDQYLVGAVAIVRSTSEPASARPTARPTP